MKVAIVDDEKYSCKRIKDLILKHSAIDTFDIDMYNNPIEFIEHKSSYDIVFLDIDMPNFDGITLAKQMEKDKAIITFVTAHQSMMENAFGINVAGFIVKDNLKQRFPLKLNRVIEMVEQRKPIVINKKDHIYKYDPNDIVCIEYRKKRIHIHLVNNSEDIIYSSINEMVSILPKQFVLVNKSQIINIKHVKKMKKNEIILKYYNDPIEVSRRKKDMIFNLIMEAVEAI